jgi:hypothetical protein
MDEQGAVEWHTFMGVEQTTTTKQNNPGMENTL